MEESLELLFRLAKNGGPEPEEYEQVSTAFKNLAHHLKKLPNQKLEEKREEIALLLGDAFSVDTTQGFVLRKPHGYAGDFELIDRIYNRYTSDQPHLAKWDLFSHSRKSNQAVRNRKNYFLKVLYELVTSAVSQDDAFHVLNVGSGPARDVCEFLDGNPKLNVKFDCVDQDEKAHNYAKRICSNHLKSINFISANIFRFKPDKIYPLIWSAGLFDYLDDRAFIYLLKRLSSMAAIDGEIVVGNFSPENPDQEYMHFGGWVLNHRCSDELLALVSDSGIKAKKVFVAKEEEGINLFLHIKGLQKIKSQIS